MNLATYLPDEAIALHAPAADWRAAVTVAGDRLTAAGVTDPAYTAEMIAAIDTLGPYVVIAPGIALAHSRPSPLVHRAGIAWVSLAEPVEFGNAANDPVDTVIGLAALDHESHINLMAALAAVLADPTTMAHARAAMTPDELRAAFTTTTPTSTTNKE